MNAPPVHKADAAGSWTTFHVFCLCLAAALALPAAGLAAQVHESDLTVSSQVGKATTQAEGRNAESRSVVHSVTIHPDARTGDVSVSGAVDKVHSQSVGQNTSADSAVGGVNVGGK